MKLGMLLAALALMTGCATGRTLGGQVLASSHHSRSLIPAAAPRAPLDTPLATGKVKKVQPPPRAARREEVLTSARGLVGQKKVQLAGRTWPSDCTGFVEAVYAQAGVSFSGTALPGDNGVTALYRYARAHGRLFKRERPQPGDLVFFRETYDQNRDGQRNDGLTHVGLVDAVEKDGTITVIHRVKRGVVRYRMNLARPHLRRDPRTGHVLNDTLRGPGPGRPPHLTGQLFATFATVLPAPQTVAQR
jgi:hypothetical protein